MTEFKRDLLKARSNKTVAEQLQQRLVDLIDLAMQMKQAHWCVVGAGFRNVHLQLDEILADVGTFIDELAERITTLGIAPDGRAKTVAAKSSLPAYSDKFEQSAATVSLVADRLFAAIKGLRESIEAVGELDPMSEDLLVANTRTLEKHLWLVQAQEV